MEGQLKRLAANKVQGSGSVCVMCMFPSVCMRLSEVIFFCPHKLPSVYLSLFAVASKALSALFTCVGVCLLL